jgi:DNA polymerase
MIHHLSIDLETFSSVSIRDSGAWKYLQSPDFEILLFAYSLDGGPVVVIDVASGETVPQWLVDALTSPDYIKHAYNAPFEYGCLDRVYGGMIPSQWRCTMFHGLYCGYTAGLDATGKALGLPEDKQKLNTGKALIRYFCVPCRPSKSNGGRMRNLPKHDPDKWALFKAYNAQDVVTEMEIEKRLSLTPVPDWVQHQWEVDLTINQRGVAVDQELVQGALYMGAVTREALMQEATRITNLQNPNSGKQLLEWLNKAMETGEDDALPNLRKDTVSKMLDGMEEGDVKRVLEIRQELSKTSTKKYDAIEECVCADDRVRGLLQFYGANRTGRWAGRLVQVQNLPRTYTQNIELARDLVRRKETGALRMIYGSVPDTLSQLIRTAFVASPGNVLIDADFSAIEARVISWLAGEEWRLQAFKDGKDIYCESASQMFGVPVVKHGINGELRAKGKIAELALGYQGGTGALINMGALDMGLTEEELPEIVTRWRDANSKIRNLWYAMDNAAIDVIGRGGTAIVNGLKLSREFDIAQGVSKLVIQLPSGRCLYYINPSLGTNQFGGSSIIYNGVDQTTKRWKQIETYGGKLTENCVQAIARDALACALDRLEAAGLPVVFHVHDEVVIDAKPFASNKEMLKKVTDIMAAPIPWAPTLPLNAEGWVGEFFTKD